MGIVSGREASETAAVSQELTKTMADSTTSSSSAMMQVGAGIAWIVFAYPHGISQSEASLCVECAAQVAPSQGNKLDTKHVPSGHGPASQCPVNLIDEHLTERAGIYLQLHPGCCECLPHLGLIVL